MLRKRQCWGQSWFSWSRLDWHWRSKHGRPGTRRPGGTLLVTLGPRVPLQGVTAQRPPPPSSGVCDAPGQGAGEGRACGPRRRQGAGCGAGRCPAPAFTSSPQTRCPPSSGSPWRGQGSYTLGNVIPSLACEYFISGLKIEAEPSSPAPRGWRRGAGSVSGPSECFFLMMESRQLGNDTAV